MVKFGKWKTTATTDRSIPDDYQQVDYPDHLPGAPIDRAVQLAEVLSEFEWESGPPGHHIYLSTDRNGTPKLNLAVTVTDTHRPDSKVNLCFVLTVTRHPPLDQLRHIIHSYLTHEADEGMVYRGRRPFDPHMSAWSRESW